MSFTSPEQMLNPDLSLKEEAVCQLLYNLTGKDGRPLNARQLGKAIELLHQKLIDASLVVLAANQMLVVKYDHRTNNFVYTKREPEEAARLFEAVSAVAAATQLPAPE